MCLQFTITSIQCYKDCCDKIYKVTCKGTVLPNNRNVNGIISVDNQKRVNVYDCSTENIYVIECNCIEGLKINNPYDVLETIPKNSDC